MIPLPESVDKVEQRHIGPIATEILGWEWVPLGGGRSPVWRCKDGKTIFYVENFNPYLNIADCKLLDPWLVENDKYMEVHINREGLIAHIIPFVSVNVKSFKLEPFTRTSAIVKAYNYLKGDKG